MLNFPNGPMCDNCKSRNGFKCEMTHEWKRWQNIVKLAGGEDKVSDSETAKFAVTEPEFNDADDVSFCELYMPISKYGEAIKW